MKPTGGFGRRAADLQIFSWGGRGHLSCHPRAATQLVAHPPAARDPPTPPRCGKAIERGVGLEASRCVRFRLRRLKEKRARGALLLIGFDRRGVFLESPGAPQLGAAGELGRCQTAREVPVCPLQSALWPAPKGSCPHNI